MYRQKVRERGNQSILRPALALSADAVNPGHTPSPSPLHTRLMCLRVTNANLGLRWYRVCVGGCDGGVGSRRYTKRTPSAALPTPT